VFTSSIPEKDRTVLRKLAEKKAQIAALPIQKQRAEMWRQLNRLEKGKPMVWIYQIPWHEFGIDGCVYEKRKGFQKRCMGCGYAGDVVGL